MEVVSLEELLKKDIKGCTVVFPTDTVYGVGAIIDDLEAINKIYQMKKREQSKPLAILTASRDIDEYVKNISKDAKRLMDEKWPGALTLIFEKSSKVKEEITKGVNTIAFRMPDSKIALTILKHFGMMATTSVNLSGQAPINDIHKISNDFSDYIDYIVSDQASFSATPSTVIDVTKEELKIIRK